VLRADFSGVGGLFHKMHCMVHITVDEEGASTWKSGLAKESGHKCDWNDNHCDIEFSKAGLIMNIVGMDYEKKHGQVTAHLIGEVEIYIRNFIVPGEKDI